jgi:hypothetical protein
MLKPTSLALLAAHVASRGAMETRALASQSAREQDGPGGQVLRAEANLR